MTRKDALKSAIALVGFSDITDKEKEEIVKGLNLCLEELPYSKWSREAIFDACDQYCKDKGRTYLTMADFVSSEMPSHPTIKNRFGMTAKEFRDTFYPLPNQSGKHAWYNKKSPQEYIDDFIKQYQTAEPKNGDEYNKTRPKGYPTWSVIARMNDTKAWKPLLKKLGLIKEEKMQFKVRTESADGTYERIKMLLGNLNEQASE